MIDYDLTISKNWGNRKSPKVTKFLSGPIGGDAQIATRVAEGKCDIVIFFRDPLDKHPYEPDISMLMRICDVHDVPLATNPASANLLLRISKQHLNVVDLTYYFLVYINKYF